MKLNDALLWAESYNNEDTNCLITKQPIRNQIQLSCGHVLEYDALLNNYLNVDKNTNFNKHSCPYCRKKMEGFIPFYETTNIIIEQSKFKNNNYLTCDYLFKSGKNKNNKCGNCANKYNIGIYCKKHMDYLKKKGTQNICTKILKNGNRCKCKVFDDETRLCKRHYNLNKNTS